jgi:hypothetical protein
MENCKSGQHDYERDSHDSPELCVWCGKKNPIDSPKTGGMIGAMKTSDIQTIDDMGNAVRVPCIIRRTKCRAVLNGKNPPFDSRIEVWQNLQTGNKFFLKVRESDNEIIGYRGRDIKDLPFKRN